jgi:predicted nucleic acid-binding protein
MRSGSRALASMSERMLSAANLVEVGIVMQARRGDDGARDVDLLLAKLRVEIVPFTARQAEIARKAFRRYGRGGLRSTRLPNSKGPPSSLVQLRAADPHATLVTQDLEQISGAHEFLARIA